MAVGGKTAGIVAGLAVGLTAGVFLAAVNPVLPRQDTTTVAPAPEAVADAQPVPDAEGPGPKLSVVETTQPTEEPVAALPEQPETDTTPKPLERPATAPRTTHVEAPAANPLPEETDLAVARPETGPGPALPETANVVGATDPESQPVVSTEPADPIQLDQPRAQAEDPQAPAVSAAEPETALTTPDPTPAPVQQDRLAVLLDTDGGKPAPPRVPNEPATPLPKAPEPEPEPAPEVVAEDTPVQTPDPAPAPEPVTDEQAQPVQDAETTDVATIEGAEDPEEEDKPNTSGTFKTQGSRLPTVGGSSNRLATLGQGGSSSRIPRIGVSTTPDPAPKPEAEAEPKGALERNANGFEPTGKPLLSLVLLDTGGLAAKLPDLQGLGLPFAIAVSLDDPAAAQNAQTYRDAGFEVLALAPRDVRLSLSGGQTDEQVADTLGKIFDVAPQAIGLIDRPAGTMQKDQRLSRAILRHFAQTGHGLVTYAGGLNAVPRMASREGVANGLVLNMLDAKGEAGSVITRYLDRAAREARSKGRAIVLSTPAEATLGTVLAWSLSSKANNVTIAPLSANLRAAQQ